MVLEALGPHAADDDVVVRVEDVLGRVVLKRKKIIKNMFQIEVCLWEIKFRDEFVKQ